MLTVYKAREYKFALHIHHKILNDIRTSKDNYLLLLSQYVFIIGDKKAQ